MLNQPRGNVIPMPPLAMAVTSKLSLPRPASSGPFITCWPRGGFGPQSLGLSSCLSFLECVLHLALDHGDLSSQLDLRPSLSLWPCLDITVYDHMADHGYCHWTCRDHLVWLPAHLPPWSSPVLPLGLHCHSWSSAQPHDLRECMWHQG